MNNYLDEKEKRYFNYFGNPATIAHDVSINPHVDIYVFTNPKENEYIYLTKGLEEAGCRELIMLTEEFQKWPVYFLQALTGYMITEKQNFLEMETYDNKRAIFDIKDFNKALFFSISLVGFNQDEIKKDLGLNLPPLCAFPITSSELDFALKNGQLALFEKVLSKLKPYASIVRKSVV